ncbi:MAG: hypothetical protein DHS20C21_18340 [Gemmatimonadota bacterium]|nr:MAG: hypothetical protein DHS20C21_18340 [Gemmatimonadota bacterium]
MTTFLVLAAAKLLKITILGTLALVSQVTHSECMTSSHSCVPSAPSSSVARSVPGDEDFTHLAVVTHVTPLEAPVLELSGRALRIRRLAPPIRVEMTFSPDLLNPPARDLAL